MSEPVFILAWAIAGTTLVLVARTIAAAIGARGASRVDVARLHKQMEEQVVALDDAQATLTQQATQIAELQERLDFAERLLAQGRDRPALGPREKQG